MGLSSLLLSSTILANSFLGSGIISSDNFIYQMKENVIPRMIEDVSGTNYSNWQNDLYLDEIYQGENGSIVIGMVSEYYFPNNSSSNYYNVLMSYGLVFDSSTYDFLNIENISLLVYETPNSLLIETALNYDYYSVSFGLEPRINGQEINFWLMVDGDEVVESGPRDLPEFVLDFGEEPEYIDLSNLLVPTSDWFFDNYKLNKYKNNFFGTLTETISEYTNSVTNLFSDLTALFYVDNKLTFLGILTLIGFGIGITKWGINFVVDLLRL